MPTNFYCPLFSLPNDYFVSMCRNYSNTQVASETGTEDWEQAEDSNSKQQGSDANWSNTTNQEDDKPQSPQSNSAQGGEETSTAAPATQNSSSSSSGGHKDTMVFSLSRDSDLVTRYTSKRGKSRGRGQRSTGGPSRVGGASSGGGSNPTMPTKARYAPPKPGSGGITIIEPLEKRLQNQQQDDGEKSSVSASGQSPQGSPSSARPSSTATSGGRGDDTADSANKGGGDGGSGRKNRPGSGHSPSTSKDGQPVTSKPKRYSSQRQKGWLLSRRNYYNMCVSTNC